MADDLFELRNYFFLGNLAAAITEGTSIAVEDEALRIEKDCILARIAILQGDNARVVADIDAATSPVALQAIRVLAVYKQQKAGGTGGFDAVKDTLATWLSDAVAGDNSMVLLVAAMIYTEEGMFDDALKATHRGVTLEHRAAKVQILLQMDRADFAEKEVAAMKRMDEDATLTQLAGAWVHLAKGGPDVREALFIYQDLLDRHGATDSILNGIALSYMAQGRYDEAERSLQEALAKNPNNPETLINVIACAKHKQKPAELVSRYLAQLRTVAPGHRWLLGYDAFEEQFNTLAAQYVATV
mmetsp:Transcript_16014/g.32201  ORF Transcript_16014/g.32201 Transcript_16014/m.32201 type:complete len:300 (+) Transcript_16014:215-1114(+)